MAELSEEGDASLQILLRPVRPFIINSSQRKRQTTLPLSNMPTKYPILAAAALFLATSYAAVIPVKPRDHGGAFEVLHTGLGADELVVSRVCSLSIALRLLTAVANSTKLATLPILRRRPTRKPKPPYLARANFRHPSPSPPSPSMPALSVSLA